MLFWRQEKPIRRILGILEAEQDNCGGEERPEIIFLYTRYVAPSPTAIPVSGHRRCRFFLPELQAEGRS